MTIAGAQESCTDTEDVAKDPQKDCQHMGKFSQETLDRRGEEQQGADRYGRLSCEVSSQQRQHGDYVTFNDKCHTAKYRTQSTKCNLRILNSLTPLSYRN